MVPQNPAAGNRQACKGRQRRTWHRSRSIDIVPGRDTLNLKNLPPGFVRLLRLRVSFTHRTDCSTGRRGTFFRAPLHSHQTQGRTQQSWQVVGSAQKALTMGRRMAQCHHRSGRTLATTGVTVGKLRTFSSSSIGVCCTMCDSVVPNRNGRGGDTHHTPSSELTD